MSTYSGSSGSVSKRPWWRRGARFLAKVFLVALVLSLTFNALTVPPRTLRAPSGSDVMVDGARVHYEKWGTHGSPIVLVHGFFESTVAWSLVAPKLARNHVVYAIDMAGYGYSQYSGKYSLADQTALVSGFIKAEHVDRPVLVGHSLGAAVVGSVALHHADQVGGVIFADGDALPFDRSAKPHKNSGPPTWVFHIPFVTSLYRIGTRWTWVDRQIFSHVCGSRCEGLSNGLVRAWMRPATSRDAEAAWPKMVSAGMLALSADDVRAIRVPRGIIWGSEDSSSGGSLGGAQENLGHPRTVIVQRAGHLSMIADPRAFATGIETLLSGMGVKRVE